MERGEQGPAQRQTANLEAYFEAYGDEIAVMFAGVQNGDEVFIDQKLEAAYPNLRSFTDMLTMGMYDGPYPEEAKQTVYRTFHFACLMVSVATNKELTFSFDAFESAVEKQQTAPLLSKFTAEHPQTYELVNRSRHLLDPTNEFKSQVDTAAMTAFMLMEDGARLMNAFAQELDSWHGDSELPPQQSAINFEGVDDIEQLLDLLTSESAARQYLYFINDRLVGAEDGVERDKMGREAMMILNEAWDRLSIMGKTCTVQGEAFYPIMERKTNEDGTEYDNVSLGKGPITTIGRSMGFTYVAQHNTLRKQLFLKMDIGFYEPEDPSSLPVFTPLYAKNVFYDANFSIKVHTPEELAQMAADDDDEELPAQVETSSMSEDELSAFNQLKDDDFNAVLLAEDLMSNEASKHAADILSMCSQGLRRRMNSRQFYTMSHRQQIQLVNLLVRESKRRSDVIGKAVWAEPHHAYTFQYNESTGDFEPIKLLFGDSALEGIVRSVVMMGKERLLARAVRSPEQRPSPAPGLALEVELQDLHVLANNVRALPGGRLWLPISGQDFDIKFNFPEETVA